MSFRRRLEEASSEAQARRFEEEQKVTRENSEREAREWLDSKQGKELIAGEKQWFDQAIMPIFREVAAVKGIPMRSPFGRGMFAKLSHPPSMYNTPDKSGFYRENAAGRLCWNVSGGEISDHTSRWGGDASSTTFWDELSLVVHWAREGRFLCNDIDITSGEGVELIENYVVQLMASGGTRRSDESHGDGLDGHF